MGFFNDTYRDPLTIEWFDTNIEHTDTLKVINGKVTLTYVPDSFQGVTISGYSEIKNGTPASKQFIVNYTNGTITFNKDVADGTSVSPSYYGRGLIQYPSQRILLHDSNNLYKSDNAEDAFKEVMTDVKANQSQNNSRMTQIEQDRITEDTRLQNEINTKESESIQRDNDLDTRISNIVAQAGTDNTELTDLRLGADGVARTVAGDLMREIHEQQLESNQQKKTLVHGLNLIQSDTPSPLKVEFYGRTLVNYSSKTIVENGQYTVDDGVAYAGDDDIRSKDKVISVSSNEYYLFLIENSTAESIRVWEYDANGEFLKYTFTIMNKFLKFFTQPTTNYINFAVTNLGSTDFETKWDSAKPRVYKITPETANKIGVSLLDADVERLFPYVDSVQHVKNPVVKVSGKNLFKPYNELNFRAENVSDGTTSSTFEVSSFRENGVDKLKIKNTSSVYKYVYITNINLIKGQKYTSSNAGDIGFAITSDNQIRITLASNQEKIIWNAQIELGDKATPYVPYNGGSYLYAETTLAGLPNSDKKDILSYSEDKRRWEKTKWFETDVVLDGSLDWAHNGGFTGGIEVIATLDGQKEGSGFLTKYDGLPLRYVNETGSVDTFNNRGGNRIRITVSNFDTGRVDGQSFPSDMIKSYFYGWKYTGDGTTHSWEAITDPTVTSTDITHTSTTKATDDYTPYKLTYQLAEPVTEVEGIDFPKVEGDVSIQGDAMVTVGEGVIVREVANVNDSGNHAWINSSTFPDSYLSKRVKRIIKVYKNGQEDNSYTRQSDSNGNGLERVVWENKKGYDPTATYTVTYEIESKYNFTTNIQEVKASFAQSLKSSFSRVVEKQSDIATDQSIMKKQLLDLIVWKNSQ